MGDLNQKVEQACAYVNAVVESDFTKLPEIFAGRQAADSAANFLSIADDFNVELKRSAVEAATYVTFTFYPNHLSLPFFVASPSSSVCCLEYI